MPPLEWLYTHRVELLYLVAVGVVLALLTFGRRSGWLTVAAVCLASLGAIAVWNEVLEVPPIERLSDDTLIAAMKVLYFLGVGGAAVALEVGVRRKNGNR